ncbi:hypothetical protein J2T60_000859 [Natronospira proteinivora]|uniref:Uncharacterized protein n=1 Tax=Natronospira proteinivora TaxID=1807133 RepID=A0ABT1G6H9_9GAMM|nr:hypothetical protein [Natronospira proteinivora]MCP1726894.1 hypothetical protein [Natronospira proteinivora]
MNFANLKRIAAGLLVVGVLAACGGPSPIEHVEGNRAYTQVNLWFDGNRSIATNYQVSTRVPINTEVEIRDTSADVIVIHVPSMNQDIHLENVPGYTELDISGLYDRYFGDSPADLSGFDASTREAIENGEVREGMSRDAVLKARGYPPAHETPTLDEDRWTYWRNRFARQIVHFSGDEVSELEGL